MIDMIYYLDKNISYINVKTNDYRQINLKKKKKIF